MRKLTALSVVTVVLLALMAGGACAAPQVLNHGFFTPVPGVSGDQWTTLFLGAGNWDIECSGGTTLTATTNSATLVAGWVDLTPQIWKFQYSSNGSTWTDLPSLVSASTASTPPVTTIVKWQQSTSTNVSASYVRIGYNTVLTGTNSNASGTAGIIATAVPEPSSAVALATGVVGIIGLLRRRRS
jgi:hypothetical protein